MEEERHREDTHFSLCYREPVRFYFGYVLVEKQLFLWTKDPDPVYFQWQIPYIHLGQAHVKNQDPD
jgi:hypothetical protein